MQEVSKKLMSCFKGKRIGIGIPKFYQFDKMVENELSELGFDVVNFSFFEPNLSKEELLKRQRVDLQKKIKDSLPLDFALIIRPDLYEVEFLIQLKKKVRFLVGYQWDGLKVFPKIYDYIPLFDKFFSFDPKDAKNGNVYSLMNFYPEAIKEVHDEGYPESDLFYVGKNVGDRSLILKDIVDVFEGLGMSVLYYLRGGRSKCQNNSKLNLGTDELSYSESLQFVFRTRVILDIHKEAHSGLSFRIFESIGFNKKLITTNKSVQDYEFYNENNILIWKGQSSDEVKAFISKPYIPVKNKERYSFSCWIKYVLEEIECLRT